MRPLTRALALAIALCAWLFVAPVHALGTTLARSGRTYASSATGAARAVGRTDNTVAAQASAAASVLAARAAIPADLVSADSATVPDVVSVAEFGAVGNGIADDHDALQAALSSRATTIVFESGATYRTTRSLALRRGGVTLLGNGSTIVTDAAYNDKDERLLSITGIVPKAADRATVADNWQARDEYFISDIGVYQLNLKSCAYKASDAPAGKEAYSKQLMVQMCSNVDIFGCTFTTELPGDGQVVDGCTALDAYTGWHGLTIENCTVRNLCDKDAGGGIWIRDHFNMGATNVIVAGNDITKRCHDEIIAVWNTTSGETARSIQDVLIAENTLVLEDWPESPSVMAFTIKRSSNVLIENNEMNATTSGGLVWSEEASGVVVRDNTIAQIRSHIDGDTNFLMFRGTIDLVEGNRIMLAPLDDTASKNHRYVFNTDGIVRGNTLDSTLALEDVMSGTGAAVGNTFMLSAPVHVIFNGNRIVKGNTVEVGAGVDSYLQYYNTTLTDDVVISQNVFDNKAEGATFTALMLNKVTMGGNAVRVMGNELRNVSLGTGAHLLKMTLEDTEAQESCVVFAGNTMPDALAGKVWRSDTRHTYAFAAAEGEGESNLLYARAAITEANAYLAKHEMGAPALAAALEHLHEDIQCFSVGEGRYYLLIGNGHYAYSAVDDAVTSVESADQLPTYATLAAAHAAIDAAAEKPAAFLTRGMTADADGGHGYYERSASAAADTPAASAYALAAADGAVSVYQLGYAGVGSASAAIAAFRASSFHTLTFPAGTYLLTDSIRADMSNRAFYGFGNATLTTNATYSNTNGRFVDDALVAVRGPITWGWGGTPNVYDTLANQEWCGLAFLRPAENHGSYKQFFSVRNAKNVTFKNCTFTDEGMSVLCMDIYGNVDGITLAGCTMTADGGVQIRDLCNNVGRTTGSDWEVLGTTGGTRNVAVTGCTITMNSGDEGLPIFAGNEEGLGWTDDNGEFHEWETLENCLVENVDFSHNTLIMATPDAGDKRRIVGITCGYQDSPVRNVRICDNVFDAMCDYTLIQFGYAEDCEFARNTVTMRPNTTGGSWANIVERSQKTRTKATTGVSVHSNSFTLTEGRNLTCLVARTLGEGALSFEGNTVSVTGSVGKLIDSTAPYVGNTFKLHDVSSLYCHVRTVANNRYDIAQLGCLYESDGDQVKQDIRIVGDAATIATTKAEVPGFHLMTFNNTPTYNGHSLALIGCTYDIAAITYPYRRVSYDARGIADKAHVTFADCAISGYEDARYRKVDYGAEKVELSFVDFASEGAFTLASADAFVEGGGFADITASTRVTPLAPGLLGATDVGQLSGEVVGGFVLAGDDARLADAELALAVGKGAAADGDVCALYRLDGTTWELATYAEVEDGALTLYTAEAVAGEDGRNGTTTFAPVVLAVVNKAPGADGTVVRSAAVTTIAASTDTGTNKNSLRTALRGGVTTFTGDLVIPECWVDKGATVGEAEIADTFIRGTGTGSAITFARPDDAQVTPAHIYFRNCTLDAESVAIGRAGTYVFDGCTFVGSPLTSINANGPNVHVYVFNSTLRDNNPPLDDWNANESSVRSWKYAAIGVMADDVGLHVCGTAIRNYQTNPTVFIEAGHTGVLLDYANNTMDNCGGAGIVMNSAARGRIAASSFSRIGGMRGQGGYAASGDARWAAAGGTGAGVGGNAVYGFNPSYHMRVCGNTITDVMENAIEGHYWCVDDNVIDVTGYRFDDGFDTVSTEAIWGYSAFVRNNRITNPHGAGILVNSKGTAEGHPFDIVVSGNTIDKGGYGIMDDKDGIRVVTHAAIGNTITVRDNVIIGFKRATFTLGDAHDKVTYENNVTEAPVGSAHTYYVATNGSDTAAGTLTHPFATIAKATSVMAGGDTVYVRGGTYHEAITGVPSGTAERPTTIRAYRNEKVTLSAGDAVTGWTKVAERGGGAIWSAPMGWDMRNVTEYSAIGNERHSEDWTPQHTWYDNLVYVGDKMAVEGRWPNATPSELLDRSHYAVTDRASASVLKDDALPAPTEELNLTGAEVWIAAGGGYISVLAEATDHRMEVLAGDESETPTLYPTLAIKTKSSSGGYMYEPTQGNYYYVTKSLATLDAEHEWYKDKDAGLLYLWEPVGTDPNGLAIEARARTHIINLEGASYVSIEGIGGQLGDVALRGGSSHCVLTGATLDCLGHEWSTNATGQGAGVLVGGHDNLLSRCEITHAFGAAVQLLGERNRIVNNDIHDVGYEHGQTDAAIRVDGTNQLVSHNSVHRCLRGALGGEFEASEIAYNDLYDCMRVSRDGGVVYFNWHDYENSEFHHNLLHDTLDFPDNHMHVGLYLDSFTSSLVVYRNVVYGIQKSDPTLSRNGKHLSYQFDPNSLNNVIVNNTFVNYRPTHLNFYPNQDLSGTVFYNNIYQALSFIDDGNHYLPWNWNGRNIMAEMGADFADNLEGVFTNNSWPPIDPKWNDLAGADYTLREDSPAIDRGRLIAGVTDDYTGWGPDLGAYEVGRPWTAGCDLTRDVADTFALNDKIPYRNLLANRSFEIRGADKASASGATSVDFVDWTETGAPQRILWSSWGSWGRVTKQGSNCAVLSADGDALTQHVSGLRPNTTYRVGGYGFVAGAFTRAAGLAAVTTTKGVTVGASELATLRKRELLSLAGYRQLRFDGVDFGAGRDRIVIGLKGGAAKEGKTLSVALGSADHVVGTYEMNTATTTAQIGWRWVTIGLDATYSGAQDVFLVLNDDFSGTSLAGFLTDSATSANTLTFAVVGQGAGAQDATITIDSTFKTFEDDYYAPHATTFVTGATGEADLTITKAGGDMVAYVDEIFLAEWPGATYPTSEAIDDGTTSLVALVGAETRAGEADFANVLGDLTLTRRAPVSLSALDNPAPAGTSIAAFTLAATPTAALGYTELRVALDATIVQEGDVVELFRREPGTITWTPYGSYQVTGGDRLAKGILGFTFELGSGDDLGAFAVVNKSRTGAGQLAGLRTLLDPSDTANSEKNDGDRLWVAFDGGGAFEVPADADITVSKHTVKSSRGNARRLELHGAVIRQKLTNNGTDDSFGSIVYEQAASRPNDLYFEDCTFDGVGFSLRAAGTYTFVNCRFVNTPRNAIEVRDFTSARADDVRIFAYGCTFEDNAPHQGTWNKDVSGDRHSNYAAIRLRGEGSGLHAAGCTFKNLQTDSTIITQDTNGPYDDMLFVFEGNQVINCGGAGLVFDNIARGRIDANTFRQIGGMRGTNGYKSIINETLGEYAADGSGLPGVGVGGNAVFARGLNTTMRVRDNDIKDVMENGIEGFFYCISNNRIDTTGYRYDDATGDSYNGGYKTVSTEGIAANGTFYVTDNVAVNVHGRGIVVSHWRNMHPVLVSGNTVSRRANGHPGDDTSEGIKVRTDENSWANVTVSDNELSGFLNNYRVLHAGEARTCTGVSIHDVNDGKLMGDVYSNLRGVRLTTNRDRDLGFVNGSVEGWQRTNLASLTLERVAATTAEDAAGTPAATSLAANGTSVGAAPGRPLDDALLATSATADDQAPAKDASYLHVVPKDAYGRVWQTFRLPNQTCIVCLKLRIRASSPTVRAFVMSRDATGNTYPSGLDGGSYSQYKIPLTGISDIDFTTTYVCMKARGTTELGLWAADAGQTIDIASVEGWYAVDNPADAGEHTWSEEFTVDVEPTCTEAGSRSRHCMDAGCDARTDVTVIPALGHSWDAPSYEWLDKFAGVTATRTCKNDATHIETETVATTSSRTKSPTCTEWGETTYTAAFATEGFETQTTTVADIAPIAHTTGVAVRENETAPTCTEAGGYDLVRRCTVCGTVLESVHIVTDPLGHAWDNGTITTPATCEDEGVRTFACTRCDATRTEAIPATGHSWGEWGTTTPATCTVEGVETRTCAHDVRHTETRAVAAIGHSWGEASCTWDVSGEGGSVTATRACTRCDATESETVVATRTSLVPATTAEKGHATYESAVFSQLGLGSQSYECDLPMLTELAVSVATVRVGNAPVPRVTCSREGEVTLAYKARGEQDSAYTADVPTAAGAYTVRATIDATASHEGATATADFDILDELGVSVSGYRGTYDGNAHGIVVDAPTGALVAYTADDGATWGDERPTFVGVGTHDVGWRVTLADGTVDEGTATVAIAPATLTVHVDAHAIYGDDTPVTTASYDGFVAGEGADTPGLLTGELAITVGNGAGGAYAADVAAGTYIGAVVCEDSTLAVANYTVAYASGTLVVAARELGVAWEGVTSAAYSGYAQGVSARLTGVLARDAAAVVPTVVGNVATDVGARTAEVVGLGGTAAANYVLATGANTSCAWEITRAGNAASVTLDGWTFGTAVNEPQVRADFGAGTAEVAYAEAADGPFVPDVPEHAGTYYVRAHVPGTANYVEATSKPAAFVIARATPQVGVVTAEPVHGSLDVGAVRLAGAATLAGTLALAEPALSYGTHTYTWRFTPVNLRDYTTTTGTVSVSATEHVAGTPVREGEVAPTCTSAGGYDSVVYCTVCGEELARTHVTVGALGHSWGDWAVVTPATCEAAGVETRTCRRDASHGQTREVAPLGHLWQSPTYAWSDDLSSVTARRVCGRDASHIEAETAATTSSVTVAPTVLTPGSRTLVARFANPAFVTQARTVEIAATGRRSLSLAVSIDDWLEGDPPNAPQVSGNVGGGRESIAYKRAGASDDTYAANVPTTVGAYVVRVTVDETDEYAAGSATARFAIRSRAGSVEVVRQQGSWEGAAVVNTSGEVAQSVLDDVDRARVATGDIARVWVVATDLADGALDDAERATVERASKGYTLGKFFDLRLYKQVGDDAPVVVSTPSSAVRVELTVGEAFRPSGSVQRTYVVIRVHDGVPTVLSTSYEAETAILAFESDRFSTYALAWSDEDAEDGGSEAGGSADGQVGTDQRADAGADPQVEASTDPQAEADAGWPGAGVRPAGTSPANSSVLPRTDDPAHGVSALVLAGLALVALGLALARHEASSQVSA